MTLHILKIVLNVFFFFNYKNCSPIFTHMAGRTSAWKALSPEVLQASFNVSADVEKTFRSKRMNSEIFFAPSK